jgi:asparagine synthase (glutamine-hydrolysing)
VGLLLGDTALVDDLDEYIESELELRFQGCELRDPLETSFLLDTFVYMTHQLLRDSDNMSMRHSLELRVPLADVEIVRFSRSCASNYKLATGTLGARYEESGAKRVLVESCRDLLEADITNRPKLGFSLPLMQWLREGIGDDFQEGLRGVQSCHDGLTDPEGWKTVLEMNKAPFPSYWAMGILEQWWRKKKRFQTEQRGLLSAVV